MKKILILIALSIFLVPATFAQEITNEARLEYNAGVDFYKLGQYDKALTSFRRAISISPDYIDAYYNLGSILEYLKQYNQALSMFKQIILRAPDDYEAVYKAANLAALTGDNKSALEYLKLIPQNSNMSKEITALKQKINASPINKSSQNGTYKPMSSETNLFEGVASPTGVVADIYGNVYVASFTENSVLKITPENSRSIYVKSPKINGPIGMAIDIDGNLYVANYNANNVIKIQPNKEIYQLIGNLKQPYGLFLIDNTLYISLQGMHSVLKYQLSE